MSNCIKFYICNIGVMKIKIKERKHLIKLFASIIMLGLLFGLIYVTGYIPIIGNLIAEKKLSNYDTIQKGNTQKV